MRDGTWPAAAARSIDVWVETTDPSTGATVLDPTTGEALRSEIEEVSLTAEMSGGLPTIGGNLAITDGTIKWATPELAGTRATHPWARSLGDAELSSPPPGLDHVVKVSDGKGQQWVVHSGVVNSTSGAFADPGSSSKTVSRIDPLNKTIAREPLAWKMPGDGYRIFPNVSADWLHDSIARECGWYATPWADPAITRLSATMMGSCWPEVGDLTWCAADTSLTAPPTSLAAPWGVAMHGLFANYTLTSPSSSPVMTVGLPIQDDSESTQWSLLMTGTMLDGGNTNGLMLTRTGGQLRMSWFDGTNPEVPLGDPLPVGSNRRAAVSVIASAGSALKATLRTEDGNQTVVTSGPMIPSSGWNAKQLQITSSSGGGTGGVVVTHTHGPTPWATMATPITNVMRISLPERIYAYPYIDAGNGLDMLTQRATAECADMWIDSQNRLRWVARGVLDGDAPKLSVTTKLSVDNLSWRDDLASIRTECTVKYRYPLVTLATTRALILWQGSADELSPGDVSETWVEPGADETWLSAFGPIASVIRLPNMLDDASATARSQSTWVGGVLVRDNPKLEVWATTDHLTIAIDYVTSQSFKVTHTVSSAVPADRRVRLATLDDTAVKGRNLPHVNGYGRVTWSDKSNTQATGRTEGGSLEIDLSWWIQHPDRIDQLLDYLVSRTSTPQPTVTGVDIDPDPRLELGDKIRIDDPERTGLRIDLVITRIDSTWSASPTMSVSGRVTAVSRPFGAQVDNRDVDTWLNLAQRWQQREAA